MNSDYIIRGIDPETERELRQEVNKLKREVKELREQLKQHIEKEYAK